MGRLSRAAAFLLLALAPLACRTGGGELGPIGYTPPSTKVPPAIRPAGSFADDVDFLEKHGSVIVLDAPGGGRVAVSPSYQGRIMTSTTRKDGPSFGWINRKFIGEGKTGTQFDNYGGEDRFWLGPEGGQYGLYFAPGRPMTFSEWQTPPALQEGDWTVAEQSPTRVVFTKRMSVTNYSGTDFELTVTRAVDVLTSNEIAARMGMGIPPGVEWVGFESVNTITNSGQRAWTRDGGLLSIWILGMYAPAPDARVYVPFDNATPDGGEESELVNDRYFGKVPADRLVRKDSFLMFVCDGKYRSKIGLGPAHAKSVLGSYSASAGLLTVVSYDKPKGPAEYVNSMWEMQKDPYGGDVVNSYNDGPTEPGKPSLGGFYEVETSSPAAALAPGESMVHTHRTFHFVGDAAALGTIAQRALGVSL